MNAETFVMMIMVVVMIVVIIVLAHYTPTGRNQSFPYDDFRRLHLFEIGLYQFQ